MSAAIKKEIGCLTDGSLLQAEKEPDKNSRELNKIISQIRYFQKFRFYNKHDAKFVEMINKEMEVFNERFKELIEHDPPVIKGKKD